MSFKSLAVLAVVAATICPHSIAKMRGPSTPEERMRALAYVRDLEENPIGRDTLEKRMWLTEWIVQVPDITVDVNYEELDSLDQVNDTYSNQLRMQAVYSQAAYILQHPEVKDVVTLKAAGLEGTLRAYQTIQKFDPSARYPLLDDLLALERNGKLQQYVAEHEHSSCSEKG